MRRPRDPDGIELERAGVFLKCDLMTVRERRRFEGVATVARRALAVAAMRGSKKQRSGQTTV